MADKSKLYDNPRSPKKEQGDDEEDRKEPTEEDRARNAKIVKDLKAGKKFPLYNATPAKKPAEGEIEK